MKKMVLALIALLGMPAAPLAASGAHWTYEGHEGPEHWGELAPEFMQCRSGKMQSPIDLGLANATGHIDIWANYQEGPMAILNNGHTVQINFPSGSRLISGGREYELLQVHFHTPSEEAVNGKRYPMVAHFVHKSASGSLAVLGVFFEEGPANSELAKIVVAAPKKEREAFPVRATLDPSGLLPSSLDVWRYQGSLTTPPCSEGVNWHVAKATVTASPEQIAALHAILGDNARPLQPLNGRLLISPGN